MVMRGRKAKSHHARLQGLMKMTNRTVMVMAAGTGGHIVPGLAVAKELQARGWKVVWLGTERGMENKLVPPTGIPLERLAFHGVRGKGLLGSLKGVLQLARLLCAQHSCCFAIVRMWYWAWAAMSVCRAA
jgi:hypothetical protein